MKKRSKAIQEQRGEDEELKNAPHSFVIQRGKVGKNVTTLMNNMRKVMAPYTAENLKVCMLSMLVYVYLFTSSNIHQDLRERRII